MRAYRYRFLPRLLVVALVAGVLATGGAAATVPPAAAAGRQLHVAPTGQNTGDGSVRNPFGRVQRAVDAARPGDEILLHRGVHQGPVRLASSGTAASPITLRPAGDGTATLTANLRPLPCSSPSPTPDRTIVVERGADNWTINDLHIRGGIFISGREFGSVHGQFAAWVDDENWQRRRALPGRGTNDPRAAQGIYRAWSEVLGRQVDPAEGIRINGNDISGRGVHVALARGGTLKDNVIHHIDCGTGPGVWLVDYSDFWALRRNHVHHVGDSSYAHHMQEGIRLGSASSYNVVEDNLVEDLPGDSRAVTTDVDASYNTFRRNTVRRAHVGLNDQMSGWGNTWSGNRASAVDVGMMFRPADAGLRQPSFHSSTFTALVRCNVATQTPTGLAIGGIAESAFANNNFAKIRLLSDNVRSYWRAQGNTWNGSGQLPPSSSGPPPRGACEWEMAAP